VKLVRNLTADFRLAPPAGVARDAGEGKGRHPWTPRGAALGSRAGKARRLAQKLFELEELPNRIHIRVLRSLLIISPVKFHSGTDKIIRLVAGAQAANLIADGVDRERREPGTGAPA
jgi:hypothetical protein